MTPKQLSKLHLNQRVSMTKLNKYFDEETKYGYVIKIYNKNHQVKVWFDGEPKARVVGYTQIELA